jgi:hypothetical protein
MKVAYKVWLDNNGKAFGEGPYQLLKMIKKQVPSTRQLWR